MSMETRMRGDYYITGQYEHSTTFARMFEPYPLCKGIFGMSSVITTGMGSLIALADVSCELSLGLNITATTINTLALSIRACGDKECGDAKFYWIGIAVLDVIAILALAETAVDC